MKYEIDLDVEVTGCINCPMEDHDECRLLKRNIAENMMNKTKPDICPLKAKSDIVYMVYGGEYSDWYSMGWFKSELEAKQYCADSQDFYYREEYLLNLTETQRKKQIQYRYTVMFRYDPAIRVWKFCNETDFEYNSIGFDNKLPGIYNIWYNAGWIAMKVVCNEQEKAEKIAQDRFAKIQASAVEMNCSIDIVLNIEGYKAYGQ